MGTPNTRSRNRYEREPKPMATELDRPTDLTVNGTRYDQYQQLLDMKIQSAEEDIDRYVESLRQSVVRVQQQRADGFVVQEATLHSVRSDADRVADAQARLAALHGEKQTITWLTTPANFVDEDGRSHTHEVPKTGGFLASPIICETCRLDQLAYENQNGHSSKKSKRHSRKNK